MAELHALKHVLKDSLYKANLNISVDSINK